LQHIKVMRKCHIIVQLKKKSYFFSPRHILYVYVTNKVLESWRKKKKYIYIHHTLHIYNHTISGKHQIDFVSKAKWPQDTKCQLDLLFPSYFLN